MPRSRNNRIDVMLNDDEYAKLKSDISRAKISQAEYIRRLILDKRIREKPDDEFYNIMSELRNIGDKLNEIYEKVKKSEKIDREYYNAEAKMWRDFANKIKKEYL